MYLHIFIALRYMEISMYFRVTQKMYVEISTNLFHFQAAILKISLLPVIYQPVKTMDEKHFKPDQLFL